MDNTTAEAPDQGARQDGSGRRGLLMAGLSGAALAALATRPAAAATEESTTTTVAPKRPSAADIELLVAAQGLELAALELYVAALASDASFDDLTRSTLGSIRQHHDAYAEALGGLLGRDSITTPDAALLSARSADFGGSDAAAIITAAHDLEKALVATHTGLVGQLTGTDGTGLIASVLVVEARHIPVLATLLGLDPVDDIDAFVTNDATPLTPA